MRRNGFTLIEVLVASTLLVAALAMLWQVWLNVRHTTEIVEKKMATTTSVTHAMATIRRELRQASRSSLKILDGSGISYQIVIDSDGDGVPFSRANGLERSPIRRLTLDHEDANGDGRREQQLVLVTGNFARILVDGLATGTDEGVGATFTNDGDGIRVTLTALRKTYRGRSVVSSAVGTIYPRNP